jgi:VWFA-related protein
MHAIFFLARRPVAQHYMRRYLGQGKFQAMPKTCVRFSATVVPIVLASMLAAPLALSAQSEQPTFRASVAVVPISAVVRDGRNRVVRELQKDDFEVFEDNQPRQVVDFSATNRGPVSVAVLLDTSGSMRGPNLTASRTLVDNLLEQLTHPGDEAALFTFDKTISHHVPFTRDWADIRGALRSAEGWGVTSLYDAIAETSRQVAERQAERRALIVITDGIDNSSERSAAEVSGLASGIDVPVYVMSISGPRLLPDGTPAPTSDGLSHLASWTGGELRHVTTEQVPQAVTAMMGELRQQYFLAIESATASGWYRLDVRTKRKGLKVRTRSGYFSSAPAWATPGH